MKGFDFMSKYNIIKTMEDKAGFIADNMEMEYDGIDFDGVILFTSRLDKTIYGVTDFYGESCFFKTYHDAANYFDDIAEDMQEHIDDYAIDENSIMTLSKTRISFSEIIRGDDIDSCRMEELFDDHVFDYEEFITGAVICDGNVKVTGVEMEEGE